MKTIALLLFSVCSIFAGAQNYQWAIHIGGPGAHINTCYSALDQQEHVFVAGQLQVAGADFDPGASTSTITPQGSADAYVAKYDAAGNYLWAFAIGGSGAILSAEDIAVDDSGNVIVIGNMQYAVNVDFDPGPGTHTLSSVGTEADFYIVKYDANGNYRWCWMLRSNYGGSVTTDASCNVIFCGPYMLGDVDPGPATVTLTPGAFVIKYDAGGHYIWGHTDYYGKAITCNAAGDIFLCGEAVAATDFDPGPATVSFTPPSSLYDYVACYSSNFTLRWVKPIFSSNSDVHAKDIAVASDGSVYACGLYRQTVDMDPGPGLDTLTNTSGDFSTYLVSYDSTGNYRWGNGLYTGITLGLDVDAAGNPYVGGYYLSWGIDFDPGAPVVPPSTYNGMFLAKYYSASGDYGWAFTLNNNFTLDAFQEIAVAPSGNIYASGIITEAKDFDPGAATATTAPSGAFDAVIAKYNEGKNGVEEAGSPVPFALWPNPSSGQLTLDIPGGADRVVIRDMLGQIVHEQPVNAQHVLSFDLSQLASGLYTLSVFSEEKVTTKRFTISR